MAAVQPATACRAPADLVQFQPMLPVAMITIADLTRDASLIIVPVLATTVRRTIAVGAVCPANPPRLVVMRELSYRIRVARGPVPTNIMVMVPAA